MRSYARSNAVFNSLWKSAVPDHLEDWSFCQSPNRNGFWPMAMRGCVAENPCTQTRPNKIGGWTFRMRRIAEWAKIIYACGNGHPADLSNPLEVVRPLHMPKPARRYAVFHWPDGPDWARAWQNDMRRNGVATCHAHAHRRQDFRGPQPSPAPPRTPRGTGGYARAPM